MLKVNPYNINTLSSLSFGSTERMTNRRLHDSCPPLLNCNYFIRPNETPPNKIGEFLVYHARQAEKVEAKIWGCSDLSSFGCT